MKRIIYISLALAVSVSCQKEIPGVCEGNVMAGSSEFTAVMEELPETKIHLGVYEGKYRVLWDGYNDMTAMFYGTDKSSIYRVKYASANTPKAVLYAEKETDVAGDGNTISNYVAYYPYPSSGTTGALTVTYNSDDDSYTVPGAFSDSQTYLAGSIPSRGFPLVAVSDGLDDYSLDFRNAAGGICFNVQGGARIKSLSLVSNESDKVIAGDASITVSNVDGSTTEPTYGFTGSSKAITLNVNPAVVTGAVEATPFYVGVAPQTFPDGFSVTLNDSDGFSRVFTTTKEQKVERSKILNMPAVTFPFYDNAEWSLFSMGSNTAYEASTKTFTFADSQSTGRWFDLPSFQNTDGEFVQHPTLRIWATSSNVVLTIILLHSNYSFSSNDGDNNGRETIVATLYGQTGNIVSGTRTALVELNLFTKLIEQKLATEQEATALLKNATGIRIKMAQAANNASAPYQITLDRIVLE